MPVQHPASSVPVPVEAGMVPPPTPVHLVAAVVDKAPPEAKAPTLADATELIHLIGILIKIVGTEMSCQGHLSEEHEMCGKVLKEDVVLHLHKMQMMVKGKEKAAIAAIWVMDEINLCRAGFIPCHMVRPTAQYNGTLAQVTCIFSGNPETCNLVECHLSSKNKRFYLTSIIPTFPGQV